MNDISLLTRNIPLVDLAAQRQGIRDELEEAIARVLHRCDFILGEEVTRFEKEFAEYCGVPAAIGVGSPVAVTARGQSTSIRALKM